MKNKILLLIILLPIIFFAQVGVGTIAPTHTLHVIGDGSSPTTTYDQTVSVRGFGDAGDTQNSSVAIPSGTLITTVTIQGAGDLNHSSEYFTVFFNGTQIGGDLTSGIQDCTLRDVLIGENVTAIATPFVNGNMPIQIISSLGTHTGLDCVDAIEVDLIFTFTIAGASARFENGTVRIDNLAGTGTQMVVVNASGDLASQTLPSDITGVTAGTGLTGGGVTGNINLDVVAINGLEDNVDDIRLGGSLIQNTTINLGTNDMSFNLDITGDFHIQDLGVNHFTVNNSGDSVFGGDVYWRDGNTAGTIIAKLSDSNDDGVFEVMRNGSIQHRIHADNTTIFNEQSLNVDFRIESDNNSNAFGIDASNDIMYAGTSISSLLNNGGTINGHTIDYVASFYTNNHTNGTAIQLGSSEYIMDSGNLEMSVYGSWLPYYPMGVPNFSLGNAAQRWSEVWATNSTIQTSDITLKKDIKPIDVGLTEVLQIQPITFQWKEGLDKSTKLGFSAQQLLKIIPNVVVTHSYVTEKEGEQPILKKNDKLGVKYSEIIPILTKAIQEQNKLIKSLESRISKLENK